MNKIYNWVSYRPWACLVLFPIILPILLVKTIAHILISLGGAIGAEMRGENVD